VFNALSEERRLVGVRIKEGAQYRSGREEIILSEGEKRTGEGKDFLDRGGNHQFSAEGGGAYFGAKRISGRQEPHAGCLQKGRLLLASVLDCLSNSQKSRVGRSAFGKESGSHAKDWTTKNEKRLIKNRASTGSFGEGRTKKKKVLGKGGRRAISRLSESV